MKLIYKVLVIFSLLAVVQKDLDAKSIEFLLDHTTIESFRLKDGLNETLEPSHRSTLQCLQMKIENIGDQPIENLLPFVNEPACTSLDKLAARIIEEKYPILALYELWHQSVVRDDAISMKNQHPLDILIFKGACPRDAYDLQFVKLCQALGIQIRQANVRGKNLYDFSWEKNEWNLIDLQDRQIYLSLDNRTLISSEQIMDDPFLALRTKHNRKEQGVDFDKAWENLARFDILEPASAPEVVFSLEEFSARSQGFSLYPHEILTFDTPAVRPELASYERYATHCINLEGRQISTDWTYTSPIPIREIENKSAVELYLVDQKTVVKAGESHTFTEDNLFNLPMEFRGNAEGTILISGYFAPILFPSVNNNGSNILNLGIEENPSLLRLNLEVDETLERVLPKSVITISNREGTFDYCSPHFELNSQTDESIQSIWWQISSDPHFKMIPSNFDQIEPYSATVTLPLISETFINPGQTYYFRVKGCVNGEWTDWSSSFEFKVNKPVAVEEVEFDKVGEDRYEINWERWAEEADDQIEYLVFGSNALDFIPSVYCEKQINGIVDGVVVDQDPNDNLIAITTEPKIFVKGGIAYYRIIARMRGQLSIPSELVHVYDYDLIQPRNVLQVFEDKGHELVAKRTLLPVSYPATEVALPHVSTEAVYENILLKLQSFVSRSAIIESLPYQRPEGISKEVWDSWQTYLLPSNHSLKPKLDRIFSKGRVTLTPDTCKKAGFSRNTPQRWSRLIASPHGDLKGYWCKIYCDNEPRVLNCHARWINRIYGAECIRKCIKDNHLEKDFYAPRKFLYVLPDNFPKQYKDNQRYVQKYTILICEDARPYDHSKNKKMYKQISDKRIIKGLYTIIQSCGLWDSVFCFNNPFSKDGRIWFIDCEGHHRWPIGYFKLTKAFSKTMGEYWERCFKEGSIPDQETIRGLRRTDR